MTKITPLFPFLQCRCLAPEVGGLGNDVALGTCYSSSSRHLPQLQQVGHMPLDILLERFLLCENLCCWLHSTSEDKGSTLQPWRNAGRGSTGQHWLCHVAMGLLTKTSTAFTLVLSVGFPCL